MISSNSMGSIQAALKRLQQKGLISFQESKDERVYKKMYEITDDGKKYFKQKLAVPMHHNEKNMEHGKLFFMGLTDREQREALIRAYIGELQEQRDQLQQVHAATLPRYEFSNEMLAELKKNGAAEEITMETIGDIAKYQYATLDFSIAKLDFEIKWFENFLENN